MLYNSVNNKERGGVKLNKEKRNAYINEWKKENRVRKTAEVPNEIYEKFSAELKEKGTNFNKWVNEKIEEMLNHEN